MWFALNLYHLLHCTGQSIIRHVQPCPVYQSGSGCSGTFKLLFFLSLSFLFANNARWKFTQSTHDQIASKCVLLFEDKIQKVLLFINFFFFPWVRSRETTHGQIVLLTWQFLSEDIIANEIWLALCSPLSVHLFPPVKEARGGNWMNLIRIFCSRRIKSDNGISFCRGEMGEEERLDSLLI